jgi:hypothetical protein
MADQQENQQVAQPPAEVTPEEQQKMNEGLSIIADLYGTPITRIVLKHVVKNIENLRDSDRKQAYELIDTIKPEIVDLGCIHLSRNNKDFYILLDECDRSQDLRKELVKLYPIPDEQIEQIRTQMKIMVNLVMIKYQSLLKEYNHITEAIDRLADYQIEFDQLQVDTVKWHLYINDDWIDRIGFFVKTANAAHQMGASK